VIRLIVARYNEDLAWLEDVPSDWTVFVYNKGEPLPDGVVGENGWSFSVPNVGREAETFCRHNAAIMPAEWNVFVQGNPFDHCHDPLGEANRIVARGDRVGWLGYHFDTAWNAPPHTLAALDFPTVWHDVGMEGICPTRLSFPAGAQMVVHGSVIERRHRAWWQRAAEVAATDDWRVAHCFERMWPCIYR
jgi:hypothetical protein